VRTDRTSDEAFRLPRDIWPSHYEIRVAPDLQAAKFSGAVEIEVRLRRYRRALELHCAGLEIEEARVRGSNEEQRARVTVHPERETIELVWEKPIAPGAALIHLQFRGTLRPSLRGLYLAEADGRRYAFTQLEATDARRFFPCFDEPEFKARFAFAVTTAEPHAVISNSPVARVQRHGDGTKTVFFDPTPPLSTYLCALAVGELEGSERRMVGSVPVRVWHVPGKGGMCDFALEVAVEALRRLEEYFGLPYPYAKLDLVAVPDFEAGAMENAGAVFFRETLLLVDPGTVTVAEKKRVAEVIAHELAHMWYGDLVTMAWWDDLWLNEAFATWMALRIVDQWKPEWRLWNDFELHRAAALQLDALSSTHPIYTPVRTPAEAAENFDPITYEKGACVVRMLEHYLGPEAFRAGVRDYIQRHREGNARAADLWRALARASGQGVERVARAWIEQAGFPMVRAERVDRRGRAVLVLRQQRFWARPKRAPGPQLWPVPLVVKVGEASGVRMVRKLLRRRTDRLPLGPACTVQWLYTNADEGGFFRPLHDAATLSALSTDIRAKLTPVERMGLVGHQWAAVRAGYATIDSFLDLTRVFADETDHDVLTGLTAPLGYIEDQLLGRDDRYGPKFRAWVAGAFGPAWRRLGWDAAPEEDEDRRLLRAALLRLVGEVGADAGVGREASERFAVYLRDRSSLEPNLADSLVAIVARNGNASHYDAFRRAVQEARTPQERRRFQLGLAEFRAKELFERTLSLTLTREVATQDVGLVLVRLLGNRAAREATWHFMTEHWERLSERLPPMMVSRVIEATPNLGDLRYRRAVASFFRHHPVPTARRALQQALERFESNAELARRESKRLRKWLDGIGHAQAGNEGRKALSRRRGTREEF